MTARIYQKPKAATQSGRAGTDRWVLEFEPSEPRRADPLTGWSGSGDTQAQVRLSFPTCAAAQAYAAGRGIEAHIIPSPPVKLKLQAYSDNFR